MGLEEGCQKVPLMQGLARYTRRPTHLPALAGQDGRPSISFAQLPAFQRKWLGGRTRCSPGRPIDQTGSSPCTGGSSRRCFDSSPTLSHKSHCTDHPRAIPAGCEEAGHPPGGEGFSPTTQGSGFCQLRGLAEAPTLLTPDCSLWGPEQRPQPCCACTPDPQKLFQ